MCIWKPLIECQTDLSGRGFSSAIVLGSNCWVTVQLEEWHLIEYFMFLLCRLRQALKKQTSTLSLNSGFQMRNLGQFLTAYPMHNTPN